MLLPTPCLKGRLEKGTTKACFYAIGIGISKYKP